MLTISRTFWTWRFREFWEISFHRIAQGFEATVPGFFIRVGHSCYPCRVCRQRHNIICWNDENPGAAICPECCDHEEYQYERGERDYFCTECGQAAPYDAYVYEPCEGDIPISFASDAPRTIGTPLSQLSGRPGHPGFEEFCRIARSWGYD